MGELREAELGKSDRVAQNVVESEAFYRILCPVADVRIGRALSQIILTESMMTWSFYEFDRNH